MKNILLSFEPSWFKQLEQGKTKFEYRSILPKDETTVYFYLTRPEKSITGIAHFGMREELTDWLSMFSSRPKEVKERIKNYMDDCRYVAPIYYFQRTNKISLSKISKDLEKFVVPRMYYYYASSKIIGTQLSLFDEDNQLLKNGRGYVLDVTRFCESNEELSDDYITNFLQSSRYIKKLKSDGDFRSHECIAYLKQADIVVTNPPFSLFKELLYELVKYKKNYLLIGNQNALTYKEIFPLIQNNEAWTGYQFGEMKFKVPSSSEPRATRYWVDETGQKWRSLGNAMWLTNLDIERRHEILQLTKMYTPEEYPTYDNFNAIDVRKYTDIPCDYSGIMGVLEYMIVMIVLQKKESSSILNVLWNQGEAKLQ